MLDFEMTRKINKINNNLQNAKISLNNAQKKMNDSISFNGIGFLSEEIKNIISDLNRQKNNLNRKVN